LPLKPLLSRVFIFAAAEAQVIALKGDAAALCAKATKRSSVRGSKEKFLYVNAQPFVRK
jgi:hypothetical protein